MEAQPDTEPEHATTEAPTHRRTSSSGSGLLSRFPFLRTAPDTKQSETLDEEPIVANNIPPISQQRKTRRRRGSLRKVALLGRGAQRDKRDYSPLAVDTVPNPSNVPTSRFVEPSNEGAEHDALGLKVSDIGTHSSLGESSSTTGISSLGQSFATEPYTEQSTQYASTTDDEDILQIPPTNAAGRSAVSMSSGSDSYFGGRGTSQRRRSFQQVKSPLSYSGMSTPAMPPPDSDWDYSETEWWGWVVLTVTWFVFVIGMGSCLDVWSWAWDVGKTPYAPPELEDDETLPIVGYYPALIILTGIMAWVWVVVAWVGMKYFRHAKISGD